MVLCYNHMTLKILFRIFTMTQMATHMVNLSSTLRKNPLFKTDLIVLPQVIATTETISQMEDIWDNLDDTCEWALFGSDECGGFSYFGATHNIQELESKVIHYLKDKNSGQFYAKWELDNGYSVLNLYECYQGTTPIEKDVLCVHFGVWTHGDTLYSVLFGNTLSNQKWHVEKDEFNLDAALHLNLFHEIKKALCYIQEDEACLE